MTKHLALSPKDDISQGTFCGKSNPGDTAGGWDNMTCISCAEAHGDYVESLERGCQE